MRRFKYITWGKEAEIVKCSVDEWKSHYTWFKENGVRAKDKTLRSSWNNELPAFSVGNNTKYKNLYTCDADGALRIYTTNSEDPSKDGRQGTKAIQAFITKCCEEYGTTDRRFLAKHFGTTEAPIKNCVPKQFYYVNKAIVGREVVASCVDASSHYPANLKGLLPTSVGAISVDGVAEPTSEYPFAFYLKSGNFCQLGGADTREWVKSPFFPYLFDFKKAKRNNTSPIIDPDNETTVLMKASELTLDSVIDEFYANKKNAGDEQKRKEAKLVMNALIGMFHTQKYRSYKYAHLAAVCIARANQRMLDMCDLIGVDNVLHVAVDGCIYKGSEKYGCDDSDKDIGKFVQEFTNFRTMIMKSNTYMAMKDGEVFKFKHGSYNYYKDGRLIDGNPPTKYEDMLDWVKVDTLKECN